MPEGPLPTTTFFSNALVCVLRMDTVFSSELSTYRRLPDNTI